MAVGDQKTVKIDDEEYILQKPPARWILQVTDRCKNKYGVLQSEKYTDELIKGVVVSPKVSLDDFDDFTALAELTQQIETFLGNK